MRKTILLAATAVAALGIAVPAWSMGGSGGGMNMSNYGNNSGVQLDDYSKARKLIRREQYAEAIPYLQNALMDKPHSADILNYLGFTERMTGNYQYSLVYYQKALTEDPDHKGAHEYLGELYLMLKDVNSANAQLAELTRLCPSSCEELDVLTKKIADYMAANPTPPTTATTTPPAATTPPATTH